MRVEALRTLPLVFLLMAFGVHAAERDIERGSDLRSSISSESRIVTLGTDDTVVAVSKVPAMIESVDRLPAHLDSPFAVMITSTGEAFTRRMGVSTRPGPELSLLIPYNEQWDIERVIITGLRDEAGKPRTIMLSREQLAPTTPRDGDRAESAPAGSSKRRATPNSVMEKNTSDCFNAGPDICVVCYWCETVLGVEFCGTPHLAGGGCGR
jgi:hypothetical protein